MHCFAYNGVRPAFAAPPQQAQPGHVVIGRVTLGRDAWLGAGSVIRADGHDVKAGDALQLGRGSTIHIAHDIYPTWIGHRVTVGAGAVVHACTVGDDVVIEHGVVILDGAVVGAGAVIEAGSIVYPRHGLEGDMLHAGRPARPVRPLAVGELQSRAAALRARNASLDPGWACRPLAAHAAPDVFVGDTCDLLGDVHLESGASVWFGCRLDARAGRITIGRRANVQDNSVLVAGTAGLQLGEDSTIGHNVQITECRVGARSLVGMGSRIAAGTFIDDDCFVAAGTVTEPGQRLEGGRLWGGQPARALGPLDDGKRAAILRTAVVYAEYAQAMRQAAASA